jgi:hypothetical protein
MIAMVGTRLAGAPEANEPKAIDLNTPITTISAAAWDNAQATLAFSYLKPEETRALASVHSNFQTFQTLEGQALQAGVAITGLAGDPRRYDAPQLRETYRVVSGNYAYLTAIEALETQMIKDIDAAQKALKP